MKSRPVTSLIVAISAGLACGAQPAHASLKLTARVQSIYQLGDGSTAVSLGHVVLAGTNLNRLIAGGSFSASCASPYTGTISGERTLTSALIAQYNQLSVTVPEQLPAVRNMPGFENVPPPAVLSCAYHWTAQAEEATYSVGLPGGGGGVTIGGEKASIGDTTGFEMFKNAGGEEPSRGCQH